jgi:putative polyhydroxyalkanoate system protein
MRIKRSHSLGLTEARDRADELAAHLERQFSLNARWQGDHMVVNGTGIHGQLEVAEDYIELHVRLGLALKLMEPRIRSVIEETMDEHLD